MNVLSDLAKALSPPPPYTSPEYDGLEYRWKSLVFRPALFKVEAFLFAGIAVYFAWYFIGKSLNKRRAEAWVNALSPLLSQQFSKPSATSGLVADGHCDFFNFSTGRRNVASLHSIITLLPRHDFIRMLYRFAWGMIELTYRTEDEVELDFKLFQSSTTPGFVWGVVSKENLRTIKQDRWDLTLTRTTESPLLSGGYCVMSEYADITETLLKPGPLNIGTAFNDPSVRPYVKSLTITDQPRERPGIPIPADQRERHVILSLRLPPQSHLTSTIPLIKSIFTLIDALESNRLSFRPETRTKLRKAREELDETIRKESEAEEREEKELDKAAARKKAHDERIAKLSAAEQQKELERGRKRQMRKAQGRITKK
ncbi:DUF1682-domain-containing protein [Fomitiporia mediterranea MF3/22]|uniref:DUF1682-domain-containing protein n=1 Tax=Fomitiporia mediterranea (strain MF3/22) TaxID=694068 RepID=UPI00044083B9|nr:DUF1682-domain-containing protein [Fomitiporia mediterranea MF3/22]EJD01165.1 DUF1682-domain-containing protein [Fomitiporia mediterranea MF3/22]